MEKATSVLNLNKCSKEDILNSFLNTYHLYELLFSAIKDEKYFYTTPDRLRLPLIFYYAHTATLYVNKMMLGGLIETRINYKFEKLFETGVDEMSWDDTENYRMGGTFDWPSLQEVIDYRAKVKEMVINFIETTPLSLPVHHDHPWWSLLMGIAHERVHLETTSVLLQQLPREYLKCPSGWKYAPSYAPDPVENNEFITVEEGDAILGKPRDFPSFGWDYEYGRAEIRVPKFEASKYTITNREFLEFVEEGGYDNKTFWSQEGWEWVQFKQAKHPIFWICHRKCKSGCGSSISEYSHCTLAPPTESTQTGCDYKYRAMFDVMAMPLDWPVDVNYHEAKAYCNWRGADYRLLTQSEHIRIRGEEPPTCDFECDDPATSIDKYNINLTFGSSCPVNYFPANKLGFHDVFGNVYQWVEDHINAFPGYTTDYLYEDMSSSYFDGRHNVMMGSSWATCGDLTSRFSRSWFRRHFFQHAGFRLARTLTNQASPVMLCQADYLLTNENSNNDHLAGSHHSLEPILMYLQPKNPQFDYDRSLVCEETTTTKMGLESGFGNPLVSYSERILSEQGVVRNRAVVFGCGPGYSCFLLTKSFNQVIGVDYGGRLIATANEFKSNGYITLSNGHQFKLPFTNIHPGKAVFKQFTWIPNELDEFDFVLFESLDRFNNPKGWLLKLHECLLPGGVVIVSASSPCWGSQSLLKYFTKWFDLLEESSLFSNNVVTAWKLK